MDDNRIIELYFKRDEQAIDETRSKYGKLLNYIAYGILHSEDEAEECVDDTYLRAWRAMPPERPNILKAFLAKITRNLSLTRYIKNRERTKMLSTEAVFEEIAECIPDSRSSIADDIAMKEAVNGFLSSLGELQRKLFVKRYFYMLSIREISIDMGMTFTNVKVNLFRVRQKFKDYLEKAGISI